MKAGDTIQVGELTLSFERVPSEARATIAGAAGQSASDPLVGKEISGYRVDEFLGRGAMGSVYRGTQLSLDRTVALKLLSPDLAKDAEFVHKFLSEARAMAKLNHPNVVQVHDAMSQLPSWGAKVARNRHLE